MARDDRIVQGYGHARLQADPQLCENLLKALWCRKAPNLPVDLDFYHCRKLSQLNQAKYNNIRHPLQHIIQNLKTLV